MTSRTTKRETERWPSGGGSSRREFLAASGGTIAAFSVLGLAACGGDDDSGSADTVILSVTSNLKGTVGEQVKRFNKQHPDGPTIELRPMPDDTTAYFDKVRTQFQAGGGDIDVISGDVIWPSQFAEPGWIQDLGRRFPASEQEKYLPGTIEAMVYQDKIYGVPWYTDAGLLYYRQDLLEDSGYSEPPKTWDELKEMSAKVQRDAGIENGVVYTGADYEGGTVLGTEFIRNAGGDILDGDKVVIGSPEAIAGLTLQQSLVADGIAPEAVGNYKEDEATQAFGRGDSVFMRMWPFYYGQLDDPKVSQIKTDQVGLGAVPVVTDGVKATNVGGGWNYYLNVNVGNADAAWKVIEFMSAEEQQKEMTLKENLLPTRKALYEDKDVIESQPPVRLGAQAILSTTTPPVSPYYSDMSLAMSEQFKANALGKVSPEDAAGDLQDKLESIIERGG